MNKILLPLIGLVIVNLPSLYFRGSNLEYTTNPQKQVPSAADSISVTPSATPDADSAWVQAIASTSTAIAITGITFNQGVAGVSPRIMVGTGAGGAETELVEFVYISKAEASTETANVYFYPPIAIPISTRVAIRMSKGGTDVNPWFYSLSYFETPFIGNATTTTAVGNWLNHGTSHTPNGTAWANSTWQQLSASTGSDWTVFALRYNAPDTLTAQFEVDLGIGAAASETPTITLTGNNTGSAACVTCGAPQILPVIPLKIIPSGSRVSVRMRKSGTDTAVWSFHPNFYQTGSGMSSLTTNLVQTLVPSAAAGNNVTNGGTTPYNPGTWVEFIASTASAISISSLSIGIGSFADEKIYQIGVGAVSSEVVVGRVRALTSANGDNNTIPIIPAINVASGQRVSVRQLSRVTNSNTDVIKLGYISNPDFEQRHDNVSATIPEAANAVSVTPNGTAWNNSTWVQLTADSGASSILITNVETRPGAGNPRYYEVDIGTGSGGAEVVKTTVRSFYGGNGGINTIQHTVPLLILPNQRIATRFRGSGTNTTAWGVAVRYIPFEPGLAFFQNPILICCGNR